MFIIVHKSATISIGANTYTSAKISDIAPEGYKAFCLASHFTSAGYAHIYGSEPDDNNSWNFSFWNNSTITATGAGFHAYFLCIKNSF